MTLPLGIREILKRAATKRAFGSAICFKMQPSNKLIFSRKLELLIAMMSESVAKHGAYQVSAVGHMLIRC